jgi:hypothetical protein
MSLHRKKPKMARAAYRVCHCVYWTEAPIERWHRAVSGRGV